MHDQRERALSSIRSGRLIAILRLADMRDAAGVVDILAEAGVRALELTLDNPRALDAIEAAARRVGGTVAVGAGTVRTADDVRRAAAAGATFCVCPHLDPALVAAIGAAGMAAVPGAFTATEIESAARAGADLVKLFPAVPAGPAYLRALRGPYPDVPFVPTGGIRIDDVRGFLDAGAVAVAVGSDLVPRQDPVPGLAERAARLSRIVLERLDGG